MNKKLRIYGRDDCIFCQKAIDVVSDHGIQYDYWDVDDIDNLSRLKKLQPEVKTVPQIFVLDNGEETYYIGGYEDLIDQIQKNASHVVRFNKGET